MTSRLLTIAPLFVLIAASEPANAVETHTVQFRFESGELSAPGGAERVYRRLSREAASACISNGRKTLREAALDRQCYDSLVAELVEKIDDSRLSAVHAQENGDRLARR